MVKRIAYLDLCLPSLKKRYVYLLVLICLANDMKKVGLSLSLLRSSVE